MLRTISAIAFGLVVVAVQAASAQTIFIDGFETYGSTGAMNAAGAWGDNGTTANPGTLTTTGGMPGQYMNHPAGSTAQHNFGPVVPTDAQPLVFEFDFYDDGVGNKRISGGLRTNGGGAPLGSIIEVGRYNSVSDPETAATVSGYAIRTVFIGGTPANWVTFKGSPFVQTGWHHLRGTLRDSDILFELDFGSDGTVDANRVITTSDGAQAYNVIRLGGPSELSSAGGGAGFDNVRVGLFRTTPGVFSTGVDSTASRLLGDAIDPHYTVATVGSSTDPVATTPGSPTFVLPEDGFPIPPWIANDAGSAWITPTQDDDANAPAGIYDYSIFFDLTAGEASIFRLEGEWATDNPGLDIFINGTATGNANPGGFGGLAPFTIDSGFVAGTNQLTFRVENAPPGTNPTGLRVGILFAGVPEPSTIGLALLGCAGLAFWALRRGRHGRQR